MIELIDIGANLTHDSFHDDFEEVLARARNQGIARMIVTGASIEGSEQALALAQQYAGFLFATAGIHPHHATDANDKALAGISALARHPEVRAVGETGLDFFRNFSPRDRQIESFEAHLEIAAGNGLPVFLHERDAAPTFAEVLAPWRTRLDKVVVHCFTGDKDALYSYLDLDCHIGLTGWVCDERRGTHLIPLIADIPRDRLMIETDAPYLMPRNVEPKPNTRRNEPQYLPWICRFVAEVLHESYEDVARRTTENARRFFSLPCSDAD
jgi:TatD DNase family protein